MGESFFAIKPLPPRIIQWDKKEGNLLAQATFHYSFGLPPINLINIKEGCNFMVRPEFRLFDIQNRHVKSIICEMEFEIHFLKDQLPSQEILFQTAKEAHKNFAREFELKEKKSLDQLVTFDEQIIRDSIDDCMKKAHWP